MWPHTAPLGFPPGPRVPQHPEGSPGPARGASTHSSSRKRRWWKRPGRSSVRLFMLRSLRGQTEGPVSRPSAPTPTGVPSATAGLAGNRPPTVSPRPSSCLRGLPRASSRSGLGRKPTSLQRDALEKSPGNFRAGGKGRFIQMAPRARFSLVGKLRHGAPCHSAYRTGAHSACAM